MSTPTTANALTIQQKDGELLADSRDIAAESPDDPPSRRAPYLRKIPSMLRALADMEDSFAAKDPVPFHLARQFMFAAGTCKILELDSRETLPERIGPLDLLALAVESRDTEVAMRTIEIAALIVGQMGLPYAETKTFYTLWAAVQWEVISRIVAECRTPRRPREKECVVRRRLAESLQARSEVRVLGGSIDVLSNTQIIEVKRASRWRTALGQVIDYSRFYPKHQKRVHLFDAPENFDFTSPKKACAHAKVIVTWE